MKALLYVEPYSVSGVAAILSQDVTLVSKNFKFPCSAVIFTKLLMVELLLESNRSSFVVASAARPPVTSRVAPC